MNSDALIETDVVIHNFSNCVKAVAKCKRVEFRRGVVGLINTLIRSMGMAVVLDGREVSEVITRDEEENLLFICADGSTIVTNSLSKWANGCCFVSEMGDPADPEEVYREIAITRDGANHTRGFWSAMGNLYYSIWQERLPR